MIKLYNEDCLEGMKNLPAGSIDLIATDPPYFSGMTSSGYKKRLSDYSLTIPFWKLCFAEWSRVLKDGGQMYICTDWRTYPFLFNMLDEFFILRNLIVWDYGWMKAGSFYRFRHELIIFATHGKARRTFANCNDNCDVWQIKCINYTLPTKLHQAQKPVELMAKMIENSSRAGDTVLDCFMGSGTTAIACLNLGRNFIGYEIDARYFEVAQKRLAAHGGLFTGDDNDNSSFGDGNIGGTAQGDG